MTARIPRPGFYTKLLAPQYLALAAALVIAVIWVSGDILVPFFLGFVLAYLFDPSVAWMARRGIPRPVGAFLVTATLVVIVGGLIAYAGPMAYAQLHDIVKALRSLVLQVMTQVRREMVPYFPELRDLLNPAELEVKGSLPAFIISGGMRFASVVGLGVLTPVITFYLLNDWHRMTVGAMHAVPARDRAWVQELVDEINRVLSGFLRGQAWVCVCVAALYSTGLLVVGLNYALLIGVMSGALKFLPYIGTAIGFSIAIGTAMTQSAHDAWLMSGVMAVYLIVELIESSILSPKLIGNLVRLPPVMVIFAVLLGGKLLGVIGMFVAIPVFAVGRVMASYWQKQQNGELSQAEPRAVKSDKPEKRSAA